MASVYEKVYSDSDCSYEVIPDSSDASVGRDTTSQERTGENHLIREPIHKAKSFNLLDVISDYTTPPASEMEDVSKSVTNSTDKDLLDGCMQKGLESLKHCEKQGSLLRDLIDNRRRKNTNPRLRRQDKSSARLHEFLGSIEAKLTSMGPTIIASVIIGFCCAFVMLVVYTLLLSSLKSQELEHYANMTQEQRIEKEKYRTQSEEHRETMLHQIKNQVHKASDSFHNCQRDLGEAQQQVVQQTEALRSTQETLQTLLKTVNEVRQNNKKLEEDLKTLRAMKDRYDYTTLAGLFICLIAAVVILPKK